MAKQPQLAKIPFTLFFQPQEFGDKLTLSSRLKNAANSVNGDLFDGEALILPVPPNGPPDVPRIQLESRDKSHVMQISLHRMNIEWNQRIPQAEGWIAPLAEFTRIVEAILRVFVGEYARPVRFALNPQFIHAMDMSANEYLAGRVIQAGRVNDCPAACKIGLLDQMNLRGRIVNLWMNISSARQQNNPQDDRGLIIHFDYNSAAEETRPYTADEILGLLSEAEALMNDRIAHFFKDLFGKSES